jgi:predicted nuclease of predicted toxin-antitoxin system
MKFLVDENLPPQLAVWLCELGHDAVHVARLALKGQADASLLHLSNTEQRIIVTKDSESVVKNSRLLDGTGF